MFAYLLYLVLTSFNLLCSAQFDTNPIFLNESYASGFLSTGSGADLFYIAFESRNQPENDPLVIWLTGGPGCSGQLALFTENGPFTINSDDSTLSTNPYSWNNQANLLYVDQPAGTGYSTVVNYLTDESQIAADFYSFFIEFLNVFPQYKQRALYITGESFAGHYIPAIGTYFIDQRNPDINLQGVAIGNGWVDPMNQYPAYSVYAYQHGLINESQYQNFSQQVPICNQGLLSGNPIDAVLNCSSIIDSITGNPRAFNVYDIRLPCIGSLCYNFTPVVEFLKQASVQAALGVTGKRWIECSSLVSEYLQFDHQVSYASNVTYLLNNGISVLAYSGIEDFICNYIGGEAWTNALDYPGHEEFINTQYFPFGENGLYKSSKGLTWFLIIGAGHLASMDQPETAVDMLNTFMTKGFNN